LKIRTDTAKDTTTNLEINEFSFLAQNYLPVADRTFSGLLDKAPSLRYGRKVDWVLNTIRFISPMSDFHVAQDSILV